MTFAKAFARFESFAMQEVALEFTPAQQKLLVRHRFADSELTEDELPEVKTSFFNFYELDTKFTDALWENGLAGSNLEKQVAAKTLVPFAAINTNGASLDDGHNEFKVSDHWGVLCLQLAKGHKDDCPIVWVFEGKQYPWADKASALDLTLVEAADEDDDDFGDALGDDDELGEVGADADDDVDDDDEDDDLDDEDDEDGGDEDDDDVEEEPEPLDRDEE